MTEIQSKRTKFQFELCDDLFEQSKKCDDFIFEEKLKKIISEDGIEFMKQTKVILFGEFILKFKLNLPLNDSNIDFFFDFNEFKKFIEFNDNNISQYFINWENLESIFESKMKRILHNDDFGDIKTISEHFGHLFRKISYKFKDFNINFYIGNLINSSLSYFYNVKNYFNMYTIFNEFKSRFYYDEGNTILKICIKNKNTFIVNLNSENYINIFQIIDELLKYRKIFPNILFKIKNHPCYDKFYIIISKYLEFLWNKFYYNKYPFFNYKELDLSLDSFYESIKDNTVYGISEIYDNIEIRGPLIKFKDGLKENIKIIYKKILENINRKLKII